MKKKKSVSPSENRRAVTGGKDLVLQRGWDRGGIGKGGPGGAIRKKNGAPRGGGMRVHAPRRHGHGGANTVVGRVR